MTDNNYKVSKDVIADTIGTETIILHLKTGVYYACNDLSSILWIILESGVQEGKIYTLFDLEEIHHNQLTKFLESLLEEGLIESVPIENIDVPTTMQLEKTNLSGEFKLEKYTDMKELLELDPVHEVFHHSKKSSN